MDTQWEVYSQGKLMSWGKWHQPQKRIINKIEWNKLREKKEEKYYEWQKKIQYYKFNYWP